MRNNFDPLKFDACFKGLGILRFFLILLVFQAVALEARAGNFITYGPEDFAGKTINTNTFSVLNPSAAYKLLINNGGANAQFARVVSSGLVKLNGAEVVSPSDFNQNVKVIEKPITLLLNNALIIDLSSNADSGITLQIIGDDTDKPAIEVTVSPQANARAGIKTTPQSALPAPTRPPRSPPALRPSP